MRKLLGGSITVTDAEVDDYLKSEGSTLTGTEAEKREAAKKTLTDQKLSDEIN